MSHERTAMPENLTEKASTRYNGEAALSTVERNKRAAGPDGVAARELRAIRSRTGRRRPDGLAKGFDAVKGVGHGGEGTWPVKCWG